MKIVCVSDTHGNEPKLPYADLLIHAGDWSGYGHETETRRFIQWMDRERHKFSKVIIVPGNHDRWVEKNQALAKKDFEDIGVTMLIDESDDFAGAKIYGSPWSPVFGKWAFMADEAKRKLAFDSIPFDTSILVTHAPPQGQLDRLGLYSSDPFSNVGCPHLLDAVIRVRPELHVFGHIHEGAGTKRFDQTLLVNASHMDDNYRPVNGFTIIQL